MTQEEIEELEQYETDYKKTFESTPYYSIRERVIFLRGKKEEHDKVIDIVEMICMLVEKVDKLQPIYTWDLMEILEKLQS